jgi:hypothetical protein
MFGQVELSVIDAMNQGYRRTMQFGQTTTTKNKESKPYAKQMPDLPQNRHLELPQDST